MSVTFPNGFLWGTAAAAHQIEGGNWNNDWWEFEHKEGTPCVEPSGDCTDSYHRYTEDIALVRDMGLGDSRFLIESALDGRAGRMGERGDRRPVRAVLRARGRASR